MRAARVSEPVPLSSDRANAKTAPVSSLAPRSRRVLTN